VVPFPFEGHKAIWFGRKKKQIGPCLNILDILLKNQNTRPYLDSF
jgi:hypothetical protein